MEVFVFVGIPFGVFLAAFAWAGYAIGRAVPEPDPESRLRPDLRTRLGPGVVVLVAAILTALGCTAAAIAGAFARTTDVSYPIEPSALLLALETCVDIALAIAVIAPGWSPKRAWIMRTIGVYWLCVAIPTVILADAGPNWLSANPAYGMTMLAVPAFSWEAVAVLMPALLILRVSQTRTSNAPHPSPAAQSAPED